MIIKSTDKFIISREDSLRITRTDRRTGASLTVPDHCYVCFSQEGKLTEIKNIDSSTADRLVAVKPNNSVLMHCSCDIAICRDCARRLLAEQEETFRNGLYCPQCSELSKDMFRPTTYQERSVTTTGKMIKEEAAPSSVKEVDIYIDELIESAIRELRPKGIQMVRDAKEKTGRRPLNSSSSEQRPAVNKIGHPELLAVFCRFLELCPDLPLLRDITLDNFYSLSDRRAKLTIARLELSRRGTGEEDPLAKLCFITHSWLMFAIRFAHGADGEDLDLSLDCCICGDRAEPIQAACFRGCRYTTCGLCVRHLMKRKNNLKVSQEGAGNYYQFMCIVCQSPVAPFTNSNEIQDREDRTIEAAQPKAGGRLETIFNKMKDFGVTSLLVTKDSPANVENDFDVFKGFYIPSFTLAALVQMQSSYPEYYTKSTSNQVTTRRKAKADPAKLTSDDLRYPLLEALVTKKDVFLEKLMAFQDAFTALSTEVPAPSTLHESLDDIVGMVESPYDHDAGASRLAIEKPKLNATFNC